MYNVKDSLAGVKEVSSKLRIISDSFKFSADVVIIEDLLKEIAHVETMLKRLDKAGVR